MNILFVVLSLVLDCYRFFVMVLSALLKTLLNLSGKNKIKIKIKTISIVVCVMAELKTHVKHN